MANIKESFNVLVCRECGKGEAPCFLTFKGAIEGYSKSFQGCVTCARSVVAVWQLETMTVEEFLTQRKGQQ